MSDLREAAEAVLEAWVWDWSEPRNEALKERMESLRQALAQPEQEWVGLTDEEYDELMISGDWGGSLIQATEAKLKEKNT